MWACLATMAAYAKDLNTAETAYAAIDEVCIITMIQLFFIYNHLSINLHRREPRLTSTAEKMAPKSKDGMSKIVASSHAVSLHLSFHHCSQAKRDLTVFICFVL